MILKNTWGKYDMIWVIGDIRLSNNPDFSIEQVRGTFEVLSAGGFSGTFQSYYESASDFQKIIYSILREYIENGTKTLTQIELATQYCMRLGLFDEEQRKKKISDFIDKMKAIPEEEKDADTYYWTLAALSGGNLDNISERGISYIDGIVCANLIYEHHIPKYALPLDERRMDFYWKFYRNLRLAVTSLIRQGAFNEISL